MLTPSQVENDVEADGGQSKANSTPIPPADLRSMVDSAARFMASIEPRFEKKLIAESSGMRKYGFLYAENPYHAYYQQQVSELRTQNGSSDDNEKTDHPFGSLKSVTAERTRETLEKYKRFAERVAELEAITVVSPINGELIPVHKMYQHMRVFVTDLKYKEQKERVFAKIRETTLAQDDKISLSIAVLARTRPDNFGTTEEEFCNAVKAGVESMKLDLDGHNATKAEDGVTVLSPSGLALNLPPNSTPPRPGSNMMTRPMSVNSLPPVVPQHGMPVLPPLPMPHEEPEPKRRRLDDSLLVPEDQFLAQHPGPVCISVWVTETGQKLEISVKSSSESVSSLKEKIAGQIEVPASKQKLSGKAGGFFKDNLSLAYYNVAGGEMLSLSWC